MHASLADAARTTGTIPISTIRSRTFSLSIGGHHFSGSSSSARDARPDSFHHLHHFLQSCHGGVSGRGHREGAMRSSAFDRPLRILSRQKSIDQPRCEGVAASHAVENLKIFTISRLVELAIAITDRAPVILRGGFCFAKRRGHHLEGIFRYNLCDHLLEALDLKRYVMLVHARHFESQRRREILLIAQHDVDVRSNPAVYFLRGFLSAMRFP